MKRHTHKSTVFTFFLLFGMAFSCHAKEISFEATVDRRSVSLGSSLQLNLTFNDTQDMPPLELSEIEGFQSRYLGPSTRMSIVNGKVSASITHVYTLLPLKQGAFTLGPLKFDYKGDSYASNTLTIQVADTPQGLAQNKDDALSSQALSDRIFLVLQAGKKNIYLNEVVPVTIKLYVNRLGVRDIQLPSLGQEGISIKPYEQPRQYQEEVGGLRHDVIEFTTSFFALRTGSFDLGPATLRCNLIVSKEQRQRAAFPFEDFFVSNIFDDFFGRYETHPLELKSAAIPLSVRDLPQEGRPHDFSGAIGDFSLEASASPAEVKVGDPVTLRMTISGEGNFDTVTGPKLFSADRVKAYEPQVQQEPVRKTFEQVVVPLDESVKEVPAVVFTFFNTRTGAYETLTKGPFSLRVAKNDEQQKATLVSPREAVRSFVDEEQLGSDIIFIKERIGEVRSRGSFLYKNVLYLWLHLLPLLGYAAALMVSRHRQRLKSDVRYARTLLAPRKAASGIRKARGCLGTHQQQEFFDAVFETLQEYFGDRFHLPSGGITLNVAEEALQGRPVSPEALEKVRSLFRECDRARYAASQVNSDERAKIVKTLEETIDYFQRSRV